MIFLIDNYDSFTFNLYQMLAELGAEVEVHRNDALSVDDVLAADPAAVVLSPGPGRPSGAGICLDLLERLPESTPLLGVCLGHQALVEHYGGELEVDAQPLHGKSSAVHHHGDGLMKHLTNPFQAGRYHSLRAIRNSLPEVLKLSAWTEDGLVMGVEHREAPRFGVQFHPESILTPQGGRLLAHFLAAAGLPVSER
ncbi:MAG: anthranilate synthase component 2 [Chlamydiales bacterium]